MKLDSPIIKNLSEVIMLIVIMRRLHTLLYY